MRRTTLIACAGFVASWLLARATLDVDLRFSDVPLYRRYGEAMLDGRLPYRDVAVEYPPGALPFFVVPAAVSSTLDGFRAALEAMLLACGLALVASAGALAAALRLDPWRTRAVLALTAASPLLLGRVAFERYDLWPAALVAAALAVAVAGRIHVAAALLGVGAAAKLYPLALVPLLVAFAWRARGRGAAASVAATALAVTAACLAPFVALAPGDALEPITRQLERPLQLESLGSAVLLAAHDVAGLSVGIDSSYGSLNLGGTRADLTAAALAVVLGVCLAAIYVVAARRPPNGEALALLAAASLACVVAFGKVLSPQFLLWLLPLVALLGLLPAALLAVALLLTNVLFPDRYLALVRLETGPIWLLTARDAVLVAIAVLLLAKAVRYERQPPVSPL